MLMMGMYGLSTAVQADTQMKNGKHQRVHVELRAPIRYQSLQRGCVNKFLIRWKHFLWQSEGLIPSGSYRGESTPCLVLPLEVTHIP